MLLQSTTTKPPVNLHHHHHHQNQSYVLISFSSVLLQNSTFSLKQPISISTSRAHKDSVFIKCSSISQVHSYGTVDYENRPTQKWNSIYKRISMMENPETGAGSILNQVENEGKTLTKWELSRIVKELRKFRRYKYALQVYDWMNIRVENYRMTTSDTAIQLDLIAKVHGIEKAEQYFVNLPDALKDKRIYGALLNAYVRAGMKEKAEAQMEKIKSRGYASHSLPYNVIMTLYLNLKDYEKVESLTKEMLEKNVKLDIYSYNIWLSSCGSQGAVDKMEQVFQHMEMDPTINPNWTTFSTMATMYIKLNDFKKGEDCLRKIESRITGRDRMPYHYLISLYGSAGNREEIYRVWKVYKASFVNIPNMGYHTVISSLIRLDDIEGAEEFYREWLVGKPLYDPRVGNLLLSSYVKKGLSEKAASFFDEIIEVGGKPNSMTWEILAEDHIKNRKVPEALSCLRNAIAIDGAKSWKPRPVNVSSILKISEQEADVASKDAVFEILGQLGCLDDVKYMSFIPLSGGGVLEEEEGVGNVGDEGEAFLVNQLQESL